MLYIHPFAEEMNKSRRMAALQSRALAHAGYDVLQIDLLGCGDSSDDFGDATWEEWVEDVIRGCDWLGIHSQPKGSPQRETPPLWLWGLRTGCLLAVDAANRLARPCNFLFWHPPSSGKQILQQFLRLKIAGDLLGGQAKGHIEGIRQQLASGTSVEIAGYMLSAELATSMGQAALLPPATRLDSKTAGMCPLAATTAVEPSAHKIPPWGNGQKGRLEWLELSTREDSELSPISAKTIAKWQQAGYIASSQIVNGPAFWQTTEIEDAPLLVAATVAAVSKIPGTLCAINA